MAPYLKAVGRGRNAPESLAGLPRQPPDRAESPCAPRTCWSPTSCIPRNAASSRPRSAAIVAQKVIGLDGWIALKSLLRPKERRGVVLIDPPFEQYGELARIRRTKSPRDCKDSRRASSSAGIRSRTCGPSLRFRESLAGAPRPVLCIGLMTRRPNDPERLNGCGLVVANPPFTLQSELEAVLPELTRRMAHKEFGCAVPYQRPHNVPAGPQQNACRRKTAYAPRAVMRSDNFALRASLRSPILRAQFGQAIDPAETAETVLR